MPFYTKNNKLLNNKILYNNIIDKNVITSHINVTTTNKLIGKNPSTSMNVYSSQSPYGGPIDAGIWVRNPDCWLNGVSNISCFSPAQRSGYNWWQTGGTLITRKHALFAKHFVPSILPNGGTPLIFVDENNNAIRRNIIQYAYDTSTDIAIALLDSEVPSNIKIAKVLPVNFIDYVKVLPYWQNTEINIMGFAFKNSFLYSVLIIDNELVVLTTWQSITSGPFISSRYTQVNNLIESLSPGQGYSLTPVDLAAVYAQYS